MYDHLHLHPALLHPAPCDIILSSLEGLLPILLLAPTVTVNPTSDILCLLLQCLFKLPLLIVFLRIKHSRFLLRSGILTNLYVANLLTWRKSEAWRVHFNSEKAFCMMAPFFQFWRWVVLDGSMLGCFNNNRASIVGLLSVFFLFLYSTTGI